MPMPLPTFSKGPLRASLPLLAVSLALLTACAPALVPGGVPSPEEVPSLEQRVRANPGDAETRVRLGAAYLDQERPAEARAVLEPVANAPGQPVALFLLGSAYEAEERYEEARDAYGRYLERGRDDALRERVEGRLALVRRRQLEAQVRESLSREEELAGTAPDPSAVAVFPFLYEGTDPQYRPLGRALAEMIVTDLARVDRIRVLERLQVQLLLDEIALAEEERVDPATAARSGRLLGAGRVVQGRIGGNEELLSVLAGLVQAPEGAEMASVDDQDAVDAFFDLQKRLVLALFASMGVELSPAEREQVLQRPTQNLQAILLYGQALEAQDQGDFPGAAELFQEAAEEDPGFEEAEVQAEVSLEMGRQVDVPAREFALEVADDVLPGSTAPSLEGIRATVRPVEFLVPGPEVRDTGPELLGTEGVGTALTTVEILLRIPR